jgi:hypothetical protein
MRKHKLIIGCAILTIILTLAIICLGSTTFTTTRGSYYGRESAAEKLTVTVVPVHRQDVNDHNDVNSTATSDEPVYGELRRLTLSATGTDVNFTVVVKDDKGISLFSKTDCNTAQFPLSYALDMNNPIATRYPGIFVAGPITVNTNNVDPVNLTGITVTLYYMNPN